MLAKSLCVLVFHIYKIKTLIGLDFAFYLSKFGDLCLGNAFIIFKDSKGLTF